MITKTLIKMTEEEVQARVDFKMSELLTAVENTAKTNWSIAFQTNSQKHSHYWEAFGQIKLMLHKEIRMATTYSDMAEHKRRAKRDEAVDKIMDRFCNRSERDYHQKEKLLVEIIKNIQK